MAPSKRPPSILGTPLTNLQRAFTLWPSATVFKIPILHTNVDNVQEIIGYSKITYAQLYNDVEAAARYWYDRLRSEGLSNGHGEVVGVCLEGNRYSDVLHIYGLMKAGYVPQTFSVFPDALEALDHLLRSSGARTLLYQGGVYDQMLGLSSTNPTLQIIPSATLEQLRGHNSATRLADLENNLEHILNDPMRTQIILHTSGSTSGIPRYVPYSVRLVDALIAKAAVACAPLSGPGNEDVASWVASVCHIGNFTFILGTIYHGSSMIIPAPTSIISKGAELKAMVELGGLTRATMFPSVLFRLVREFSDSSNGEERKLELLKKLNPIAFGGMSMSREQYAKAKELGLKLLNLHGCTECGIPTLISDDFDHPERLRPVQFRSEDGTLLVHYRFDPVQDTSGNLVELVILPTSADIPDKMFLDSAGNFHTGDLFSEHMGPCGNPYYIHQGRKDEWIMMDNACKCDAGAIESNTRNACKDLSGFRDCVVIGSARPSPVLVVEVDLQASETPEVGKLGEEIFRRIEQSVATQKVNWFAHERIASPESVIVVPAGSLSRTATKGTIRRKVVEEEMKERLDGIFGPVPC